ncbi:MAG: hypothetical protein ACYC8T_14385 [Myxococcaceae bacterium]
MNFSRIALVVGCLSLSLGCVPEGVEPDAGGAEDSGGVLPASDSGVDAGAADSGLPDAGPDAGLFDGGSEDAGPLDAGFDAGSGDGGSEDAGGTQVRLTLETQRGSGGSPDPVIAVVKATNEQGQPLSGLDVRVFAGGSTYPTVGDGGSYQAVISAPFNSGELTLTARVQNTSTTTSKTVLLLPLVGALWDQPEPVGGLVNTAGDEDSPTISPDGEWLIVGTYSPVDLVCCMIGCGGFAGMDGLSPACNDAAGPVTAPERPRMPGAWRVKSPTEIFDGVAEVCAIGADGGEMMVLRADGGTSPFALPPTASYLFHRQTDGTYAEPFVIDTGAGGFLGAPFCYTFLDSAPAGQRASVIFGYAVQMQTPQLNPHPWFGQLTMGQDNLLGSYSCPAPGGTPTFTPATGVVELPVSPVGQHAGNTTVAVASGTAYLLSDDESTSSATLHYAVALGDGGYSPWSPMAAPGTGDKRQPISLGGRLWYFLNGDVVSASWAGGPLDSASSFGPLSVELAHEFPGTNRLGEVMAVGQPVFAAYPDGGLDMFFAYYLRTSGGMNGQIGVVHRK